MCNGSFMYYLVEEEATLHCNSTLLLYSKVRQYTAVTSRQVGLCSEATHSLSWLGLASYTRYARCARACDGRCKESRVLVVESRLLSSSNVTLRTDQWRNTAEKLQCRVRCAALCLTALPPAAALRQTELCDQGSSMQLQDFVVYD